MIFVCDQLGLSFEKNQVWSYQDNVKFEFRIIDLSIILVNHKTPFIPLIENLFGCGGVGIWGKGGERVRGGGLKSKFEQLKIWTKKRIRWEELCF